MRHRHALRALLALGLAFGLALAAASVAYASTESTYAMWNPSAPNDSPATPHKGYSTTTTKCAVCHAVHKAPAGGELLLRTTVDQACVYCHIENDIGGVIYGGNTDNYTIESDHGHQTTGVTCVDCHAVHGANTFGGPQRAKILKVFGIQETFVKYLTGSLDTSAVINGVGPLPGDPDFPWPGRWETSQVQDTAFCSQCHPYYSDASETTVTAWVVQSNGSRLEKEFKTHPMKIPGNEEGSLPYQGFVARGSTVPTSQTIAVYSSRGCNWVCHGSPNPLSDPYYAGPDNSYPHYNAFTSRFLAGHEDDSNRTDPVENSSQDSACLMCHRYVNRTDAWADPKGPGGVGLSY
jgi:predicted CXXCH cytochrome family protein